MGNCALGWVNLLRSSTITASSAANGLDASQLQNEQGAVSAAWQTVAGVTTAYLIIDAGATVSAGAFGLFRTNLTSAATVRWQVTDDASFSFVNYDTGVKPAGVLPGFAQSLILASDISQLARATMASSTRSTMDGSILAALIAAGNKTGRYVRCDIADPTNPDGFLNIPLAFAGPLWTPARNFGWASSLGRAAQANRVTTRGGQIYHTLLSSQRQWKVSFGGIRKDEIWPDVMDLDATARQGNNVLFIPSPGGSDMARESVYGLLDPTSDVTYAAQSANTRGWTATIAERL